MARKGEKNKGVFERPKDSGIWWVRLTHEGREHRFKVGNISKAKAFYRKAKVEQKEKRFQPEKYHAEKKKKIYLDEYIESYLYTCTNIAIRDTRRYATFWAKTFSRRSIESITALEIEKVRTSLMKDKAPATVNRYMGSLRHLIFLAMRDGLATKNPFTQIKMLEEPGGRVRYLTEGEEMRLKEVIRPDHWPLVAFALNTGLRQAEQFNLRWDNVDVDQKVITIPRSKSGETRHVQLNDEALSILRGLSSWMTSPWVFPSQNPSTHLDSHHVYGRSYLPAVRRAGLVGVNWHTLRHTFASRLVMAGVDLRTVQELMGHKTIAMTMRYAHTSDKHRLDAVNRLNKKKPISPELKSPTGTKAGTNKEASFTKTT